jgi:LmbE family N-acetylglucosaminyl deacetylase
VDRPLTIVGCFAHPDDETWVMSGSLTMLAAKGARCAVWTATRGEAGEISDGTGVTRDRLAEVREAEEREAMALLGVHEVEFGDFRDGGVRNADRGELVRRIHDFLERTRPDVVVTMEPGGVTAHEDHMAVTAATTAAFAAYAEAAEAGGRRPRLYQAGAPASRLRRWREFATSNGFEIPDEDAPFAPKGTPDERFTCQVDTSSVAKLRGEALRRHRTQLGVGPYAMLALRDEVIGGVLGEESYIRVHPAPRDGEPPETSLVEAFARGPGGGKVDG